MFGFVGEMAVFTIMAAFQPKLRAMPMVRRIRLFYFSNVILLSLSIESWYHHAYEWQPPQLQLLTYQKSFHLAPTRLEPRKPVTDCISFSSCQVFVFLYAATFFFDDCGPNTTTYGTWISLGPNRKSYLYRTDLHYNLILS